MDLKDLDLNDNVVTFRAKGAKPSIEALIKDSLEISANKGKKVTHGIVILFADDSGTGQMFTSFYCTDAQMARGACRLMFLAGGGDDDDDDGD